MLYSVKSHTFKTAGENYRSYLLKTTQKKKNSHRMTSIFNSEDVVINTKILEFVLKQMLSFMTFVEWKK